MAVNHKVVGSNPSNGVNGELAQSGRASPLQGGGHGFEFRTLHKQYRRSVARILDFGSKDVGASPAGTINNRLWYNSIMSGCRPEETDSISVRWIKLFGSVA